MNHRALQRTLFRMQHDPCFADRVLRGEPAACATVGLEADELALLRGLDRAALSADRGGRRAKQFLRNVTSEFPRCVGLGPLGDGDPSWIEAFPGAPEFHRAVAAGTSLPRAFAAFACRRAAEAVTSFGSLVTLEAAMARARRERVVRAAPKPGSIALSPWAQLVELPAGTHALASALTGLLEHRAGREAIVAYARGLDRELQGNEVVLLAAQVDPPRPGSLRELRVELLPPLLAEFLRAHSESFPRSEWARFAREHDVDRAAVEGVALEFLQDGVLRSG